MKINYQKHQPYINAAFFVMLMIYIFLMCVSIVNNKNNPHEKHHQNTGR